MKQLRNISFVIAVLLVLAFGGWFALSLDNFSAVDGMPAVLTDWNFAFLLIAAAAAFVFLGLFGALKSRGTAEAPTPTTAPEPLPTFLDNDEDDDLDTVPSLDEDEDDDNDEERVAVARISLKSKQRAMGIGPALTGESVVKSTEPDPDDEAAAIIAASRSGEEDVVPRDEDEHETEPSNADSEEDVETSTPPEDNSEAVDGKVPVAEPDADGHQDSAIDSSPETEDDTGTSPIDDAAAPAHDDEPDLGLDGDEMDELFSDLGSDDVFSAPTTLGDIPEAVSGDDSAPSDDNPLDSPSEPGNPARVGIADKLKALSQARKDAASNDVDDAQAVEATSLTQEEAQSAKNNLATRLLALRQRVRSTPAGAAPKAKPGAEDAFDSPTRRVSGEKVSESLAAVAQAQAEVEETTRVRPVAESMLQGKKQSTTTPVSLEAIKRAGQDSNGLPLRPFTGPIGSMTRDEANALWREYVEANRNIGRDLSKLKPAVFKNHLLKNHAAICKRFQVTKVDFGIKVKNGRVSLQATPRR